MEGLVALIVIYLVLVLLVLPIWVLIKLTRHRDQLDALEQRLAAAEEELRARRTAPSQPTPVSAPTPLPAAPPVVPVAALPPVLPTPAVAAAVPAPVEVVQPPAVDEPPPLPPPLPPVVAPEPAPAGWMRSINWEQFMGAKLFAWLGGLALFLGVAFFLKYSFDHGWIPPEIRAAIGFVFGAGLVVGGLRIPRDRFAITAQTLVAAGIVSLYAVTFASNAVYHFAFFGPIPTFLVMSLVTAAAFVLAVRLDAPVVAILGILGGFLTPVLINTGHDNPAGLFGYLALLDVGLAAVALHRGWFYLVPLGATGTLLLLAGWAGRFFAPEKTDTAMIVCLGFAALFLGAVEAGRRREQRSPLLVVAAAAVVAAGFVFAWHFLDYAAVAAGTERFFGYVLLVSAAAVILAWRADLGMLVALAAGATGLLLARWTDATFRPEDAGTVVAVNLVFCAVYFGVYLAARRLERATGPVVAAAAGLPAVALAFALFLLDSPVVGARAGLVLGFIGAADLFLLALAWLDERLPRLHLAAGTAVFVLLAVWTTRHLTDALLPWALAAFLVFAALHTVFPLLLERRRPAAAPTWWSQLFPPAALLLMLFPIFKLAAVSLLLWPAILLVDVLAIGLAVLSASLTAVAAVLVLTLLATGLCLFKVPVAVVFAPSLLFVIGFFAVFFFAASFWLVRRLAPELGATSAPGRGQGWFGDFRTQLPAFACLLPFLLLIMVCRRLEIPDPSAVFGLALLLVVLVLGLAWLASVEWLGLCALAGVAGLEYAWHTAHFAAADAGIPLLWYLTFHAVFTVYPFLGRARFAAQTGPWATAALSGLAHFWMVYQAIRDGWPNEVPGLVPALFALPPLASLFVVGRGTPADAAKRLNQLAWFGGVALAFITLVFPIQFERQWLTVAWALEGVALAWLYHRVPHAGLRATGVVLLGTAFARLALNPAVLGYHVRSGTPLLNWYLYAYGIALAALFLAARLLAPPRERVFGLNVQPPLNAGGAILAFLLLNLEIADFFTAPGTAVLTFQFRGNFARDMSYTIGWALFALGLLAGGLWRGTRAARYAAIGLLSVALLKLFFHDLARLEALYRIGALFGVAVVAILASFAYQRFLPANEKTPPARP